MVESKVTLEFLKELFANIDQSINVETFEESLGSDRGDNYTASLYRLRLKGYTSKSDHGIDVIEPWETSLIYKCLPENLARREAFKSEKLFRNEVAFYTKVVPLVEKYQELHKAVLPKKFTATPRCFYAENDLIILEDLKAQSFTMADRKQGLNLVQTTAVLEELAKFHAVTLAIKVTEPDEFYSLFDGKNSISEGLFVHENQEWYRDYYKLAIDNVLEMAKVKLTGNELKEIYINKFSSFADEAFFQKMIELVSYTGPLSVLCHGDCWTNNILFKNQTNSLQVCFIDFQLCRNGSLALDLANLIYCCTTRKLRDAYLDTLLQEYHETFSSTLAALLKNTGFKKHELLNANYSFNLLVSEFRRCALFGLGLAIDIIPISTCNSEEAPDMYQHESGSESNDATDLVPLPNELCSTKMINLICELIDNGLL